MAKCSEFSGISELIVWWNLSFCIKYTYYVNLLWKFFKFKHGFVQLDFGAFYLFIILYGYIFKQIFVSDIQINYSFLYFWFSSATAMRFLKSSVFLPPSSYFSWADKLHLHVLIFMISWWREVNSCFDVASSLYVVKRWYIVVSSLGIASLESGRNN